MLNEPELELLTGAVDGELAPDRQPDFDRLVSESSSAADLFAAMVRDRTRLASLPVQPAPRGFATGIMAAITRDRPIVSKSLPARRPSWIPAALAASFLVAVSSGTYLYVSGTQPSRTTARQIEQLPKDGRGFVPSTSSPRTAVEPESNGVETPKAPDTVGQPMFEPSTIARATPETPNSPANSDGDKSPNQVLAAPVGVDVKAFDRVDVKLPLLIAFGDLARDDSQAALRANLARDPATRIDLFAKDTTKAAEALVASAKKINLAIQTETVAGERMKRKMPSAWWIYTDSLTPDDVAKWLLDTAETDSAAPASDRIFGSLHAVAAGAVEQKDALALAGVDLGIGKKPAANPGGAHIASKTIDQVTSSLQKAETPKPGILLTYLPQLVRVHPLLSKDIKQYHELRKDRKPNAVPLVVVIRPVQ